MDEIFKKITSHQKQHILIVEKRIKDILEIKNLPLASYFETFLFNGAKRLRPLFIFLISGLLNFEIDNDVYNLAASVELLHSASLIHDDILDDARLRRGLMPLHIEKGNKIAVLAGDFLLSSAMKMISKINNRSVLKILADTASEMTTSEINSLLMRGKKISVKEYIEISKGKTSSLFKGAIFALYALKNRCVDLNIKDFTENFSLIFQIKDDLNNFLQADKNKLSDDLLSEISTLPSILGAKSGSDYDIMEKARKFINKRIEKTELFLKEYNSIYKEDLILLLNLFRG